MTPTDASSPAENRSRVPTLARDAKLRRDEALALALDATLTSIWDYDFAANNVTLDANWSRMRGGPTETTTATIQELHRLIHEEDRARARRASFECLGGGADEYSQEYRVRDCHGGWLWVHSRGRVLHRDAGGRAVRMIGTNIDITQRKTTELATTRQMEFLRALNETALAVLQRRAKTEVLDALAGHSAHLLKAALVEVALRDGEVLVTAARGGVETVATVGQRFDRSGALLSWRAVDGREPVIVDHYAGLPDGVAAYREAGFRAVAVFPILFGSRCLGVLGVLRDRAGDPFSAEDREKGMLLAQMAALAIHNASIYEDAVRVAEEQTAALRESERLYRTLVESVHHAHYVADRRSLFTYCNPAFYALGGYTTAELMRQSSFRLVAAEDRPRVVETYRRWLADPTVMHGVCEFRAVAKDGRKFWVEQTTTFVRDAHGRVLEGRNLLQDITARKAAEAARDRSLAIARATLESTTDGILVVDAQGRIEAGNATLHRMWRTPEHLLHLRDARALDWPMSQVRDPAAFRRVIDELRATPHAESSDTIPLKDGRIFERYSRPLLVDEQPAGRVWSFRDVTAARAAEAALRESEEQFKNVFADSPLPLILLDRTGRILEVNRAAADTFGYTREETIGKTTLDLETWADLRLRQHFLDEIAAGRDVHGVEVEMQLKNGGRINALFHLSRIVVGGKPCMLSSVIDITGRKRAESLFRDLFAFSPDACVIANSRGEIIDANEQTLELFGYTRAELVGVAWTCLVPPEARPRLEERLQRYFANPVPHPMGRSAPGLVARHKDGRIFPIDISLSPLKSGGEVRIVAAIRDITAQLKAEEALRRSEAELRQAQKMESLGTLAGGIAHDFNNILTGILGYTQLALVDLDAAHPARQWLEGTLKSGERAKNLVNQILTFSRKTESTRSPVRLQQVLVEAAELLRSTLPPMVRLEADIDRACPPVLANANEFHQVILNLCTNAWHALPTQGGRIAVALAPCPVSVEFAGQHPPLHPGAHVRLAVSDNGCGMSAATLERIFEPFFTTKEAGKGTGLGLAVVHSVVTAHGGGVFVQSAPGEGTTFEIYLPALAAEEPAAGVAAAGELPRGGGESILVVDDEPSSGGVITQLAERLGYRPTYCADPREALTLVRTHAYAALVTDLAMPGLTGDELARQALAARPDLPVLLLSGFIEPATLEKLRRLGVREVLAKPPGFPELAAALQRCARG